MGRGEYGGVEARRDEELCTGVEAPPGVRLVEHAPRTDDHLLAQVYPARLDSLEGGRSG